MPIGINPMLEQLATVGINVDGHAALRGNGTASDGLPTAVISVPDRGVVVAITGSFTAGWDEIFASIRVAARDALGCQDHVDSFLPPHNAASTVLVPDRPESGVVCEYLPPDPRSGHPGNWLAGSRALTPAELQALPGQVNDQASAPLPSGRIEAAPYLWLQLQYPGGSKRTVASTLNSTPTLITDGIHTVTPADPAPLSDAFRN